MMWGTGFGRREWAFGRCTKPSALFDLHCLLSDPNGMQICSLGRRCSAGACSGSCATAQ
jgi:hypothetical protein